MATREEFVQNLIASELLTPSALQEFIWEIPAEERPTNGAALARCLVGHGWLTRYQADAVLKQEYDRLSIGQYDVLDQIGAGGMGAVYKARHRRMNRTVAIKMIIRRHGESAEVARRFEREIRMISDLQHPNIVVAHDADECAAGPFLVMEYIVGDDLDKIIRRQGPLSVTESVDGVIQCARGLEYAHNKHVIHRDIKPANLLRVEDTGCIKITDLGLARIADDPQDQTRSHVSALTETGNILGTVLFMAPEQSVDTKEVDHRCDIYSLGCTLYHLLHGRPPFRGDSRIDTIMLHREGPIPSLAEDRPDVPPSLAAVFQKMLAKAPEDRFQTMGAVIAALESCEIDPSSPNAGTSLKVATHKAGSGPLGITEEFLATKPTTLDTSVLLVEPSGAQAIVIRGFLESQGIHQIRHCRNGTEALKALPDFDPDVIVCAMHLDDVTGIKLAELAAQVAVRKVGFVLISSSIDAQELKDQAKELGMELLAKPFDADQLYDKLHALSSRGPE